MFRAEIGFDLYLSGPAGTELDHAGEEEARQDRAVERLGGRRVQQTRRKRATGATEKIRQVVIDAVPVGIDLLRLRQNGSEDVGMGRISSRCWRTRCEYS